MQDTCSTTKEIAISAKPHPRLEDLKNKKFGKWTVIEFSEIRKNQRTYWKCKCDCGNEKIVGAGQLKSGCSKSCGCIRKTGYKDITGYRFSNIKLHARDRHLEFNVTIEEIWDLFIKQDKKCAISGVEIGFNRRFKNETTASLDRIDSNKGYFIQNIQWVHKKINKIKMDLPQDEFFNWVKLIYNYRKQQNKW